MKRIFLPGTPIYKRVIAFAIFLLLLSFFPGDLLNFLPSEKTDLWGKFAAAILTILFTVSSNYAIRHNPTVATYCKPKNKTRRWLMFACTPIFLFYLFYISCAYGLGWMLHSFTKHQDVVNVTVCKKGTGSISGPTLDFKKYKYLWYKHLQHLQRDKWEPIKVGDKLILIGTESKFGFRVYDIMERK